MARQPWYRRALPRPGWPPRRGRSEGKGAGEQGGPGQVDPLLAWFGFLGGAAAWILHLTIGYSLSEIACHSDRLAFTLFGLHAHEFLGYTITLLAALTALAATFVAYALKPEGVTDEVERQADAESEVRSRFMAYAGMVMSGLFTIAILAGGLGYFFLNTCV